MNEIANAVGWSVIGFVIIFIIAHLVVKMGEKRD